MQVDGLAAPYPNGHPVAAAAGGWGEPPMVNGSENSGWGESTTTSGTTAWGSTSPGAGGWGSSTSPARGSSGGGWSPQGGGGWSSPSAPTGWNV
jgi:hypothetical protein